MRRILTRPATHRPTKRFLATNAERRLHPQRGEKGRLTRFRASHPLMRDLFSGGGYVRRRGFLSNRQVDGGSGTWLRISPGRVPVEL
jgi:hypothetical protein